MRRRLRREWRQTGSLALLWVSALGVVPAARAQEQSRPLQQVTCSLSGMLEDLRAGLKRGSPAYKSYLRKLLTESAISIPLEELNRLFESERDPDVLEALGAALASKASRGPDPKLIKPLLVRATRDADPALRAAAVRGLRGMGSVEAMAVNHEVTYEQLMRDSSPEVRRAVADNLIKENAEVYSGHDKAVSEMAVAAAAAAPDPEVAATLLKESSMEHIGSQAVQTLTRELRSESPKLRAAAALALGGVPGQDMQGAQGSLVDLYRSETDPSVRKAILESIARLGFSRSVPVLDSLRGVDPSLAPEIDAWNTALKSNLQEWNLLKRQKERLTR